MIEVKVIKKDGNLTNFKREKIKKAISKSAERVLVNFTELEKDLICDEVKKIILKEYGDTVPVNELHNIVENSLDKFNEKVANSYREYRNYKTEFVGMLDEVYKKAQSIMYLGDKENSNTDSALVSTKRSLIYNELNKELYNKFFLTNEEKQACIDGYIYIHDKSARRDTISELVA